MSECVGMVRWMWVIFAGCIGFTVGVFLMGRAAVRITADAMDKMVEDMLRITKEVLRDTLGGRGAR